MSHWFDQFTKDIAAARLSRRSAVQLAVGFGLTGSYDIALAREPAVRTRPPRGSLLPILDEPPLPATAIQLVQAQPAPRAPAAAGPCVVRRERGRTSAAVKTQTSFQGRPLTLESSLTNIPGSNGSTVTRTVMRLAGDIVLDIQFSHSPSSRPPYQGQVHLGAVFKTQRSLIWASEDGRLVRGTLDGRRLAPFTIGAAAPPLRFADGGTPPPPEALAADFEAAVRDLLSRARINGETCRSAFPPARERPPREPRGPQFHALSGHHSNTDSSGACNDCKLGCTTAGIACGIGFGVACAFTFGIGCAVGVAGCGVTVAACFVTCQNTVCCPVGCGSNVFECCFNDETCLNPAQSLCCDGGTVGCAGMTCCDPTDTCMSNGTCCPKPGVPCGDICCPGGAVCQTDKTGPHCCTEGHVLCNGVCCDDPDEICFNDKTCCLPEKKCGSTCCDKLSNCANESKGLCCSACNAILYEPLMWRLPGAAA